MNELSTHLVKLDVDTILANYKKPDFWSKTWTIFKGCGIEVTWCLTYINCIDNTIGSKVMVKCNLMRRGKRYTEYDYNYCSNIPINHEEYSQTVFENNIIGTALRTTEGVERMITRRYAEYSKAELLDEQQRETLRDIANEFLDNENVKNEDIRDAYISSYVDTNATSRLALEVIANFKYKILSNAYLMFLSFFNNKDEFEKYKKLIGVEKKKHIWYKLWQQGKELCSEEYVVSMKEKLEKI